MSTAQTPKWSEWTKTGEIKIQKKNEGEDQYDSGTNNNHENNGDDDHGDDGKEDNANNWAD